MHRRNFLRMSRLLVAAAALGCANRAECSVTKESYLSFQISKQAHIPMTNQVLHDASCPDFRHAGKSLKKEEPKAASAMSLSCNLSVLPGQKQ